MKSKEPLDPTRLTVKQASVNGSPWANDHGIRIDVTFYYQPWCDEEGQDVLWEEANALTCLRKALERGGVTEEA